jgi:hypothetical protein
LVPQNIIINNININIIGSNDMGDKGAFYLIQRLHFNNVLTELNLDQISLKGKIEKLAEALKIDSSLRRLSLCIMR